MDDYDWDVLSDAYDKAKEELATLRAEVERLKQFVKDQVADNAIAAGIKYPTNDDA